MKASVLKEARSSGIRIRYEEHGDGDLALLCLPGWCIPRTLFSQFARTVGERMRVLSLDWRGHGDSGHFARDFGTSELADDAMAVIQASGARRVIPLAQAHAGWVALELKRRLGARAPALIFTSWLLLEPPPPFASVLESLQDPARWKEAREHLLTVWLHQAPTHVSQALIGQIRSHGYPMWARAGREINAAYARFRSGLHALSDFERPAPALHLYAQPRSTEFLMAQADFAAAHDWFRVKRLDAASHFPTLEIPEAAADAVLEFVDRCARADSFAEASLFQPTRPAASPMP